MNMQVVTNSGPLIVLGKLNRLELLENLFGQVTTTEAVYQEVVVAGLRQGRSDALVVQLFWKQRQWPIIKVPHPITENYTPTRLLDRGEQEVLAWASQQANTLVLMDDEIARQEARLLGLTVRGSLGVLVQAHHQKILPFPQVELLIQEIAARSDIWISARLCQQVLDSLQQD